MPTARSLTATTSSSDQVLVERFGSWPDNLYFTLRNLSTTAQAISVTIDRNALGLSGSATITSLVQGAPAATLAAANSALSVTLPAGDVEALQLTP